MGVDFFPCTHCKGAVCDCGDFEACQCGKAWCSKECAVKDGWQGEDGDHEAESCNFCRGDDVGDSDLLVFLLKKHKMTRTQAIKEYIKKHPLKKR